MEAKPKETAQYLQADVASGGWPGIYSFQRSEILCFSCIETGEDNKIKARNRVVIHKWAFWLSSWGLINKEKKSWRVAVGS